MASSILLAVLALTSFSNAFVPSATASVVHVPTHQNITQHHHQLVSRDVGTAPHLAMAIDTTGSMGNYIRPLRTEVRRIVTGRIGSPDAPSLLALSPFHDPSTGPVTAASDPIDFLAALDTLSASGGGDCPELSLTGALTALDRLTAGGTLIVVTDASAKDADRKGEVIAAALLKRVKVLFFLFDNICGTGEPAYDEIALTTGGQVLTGLAVEDAAKVSALVDFLLRRDVQEFARVLPQPSTALVNLTAGGGAPSARRESVLVRNLAKRDPFAATTAFAVDPSVSSFIITVDGARSVTVTRPDGRVAGVDDNDFSIVVLSRGVVIILTAPSPGAWTVSISDCDACSVSISGQATVYFDRFALTIGRYGPPTAVPVA
jgi:hypothetical protein